MILHCLFSYPQAGARGQNVANLIVPPRPLCRCFPQTMGWSNGTANALTNKKTSRETNNTFASSYVIFSYFSTFLKLTLTGRWWKKCYMFGYFAIARLFSRRFPQTMACIECGHVQNNISKNRHVHIELRHDISNIIVVT